MTKYLYPQNLTAKANLWLWSMRDFILLCILATLSLFLIVGLNFSLPLVITMCYAFLTIRREDLTILDFLKYATRYFITNQQSYKWEKN